MDCGIFKYSFGAGSIFYDSVEKNPLSFYIKL